MTQTTPSTDHPLLNEQNTVELEGVHFTKQKTNNSNYKTRYRCFSTMNETHIENILRHLPNGEIHRTTTFYNKYGQLTNQVSQKIEDIQLEQLDRKNVKTLIQNYMMNKAQFERRR